MAIPSRRHRRQSKPPSTRRRPPRPPTPLPSPIATRRASVRDADLEPFGIAMEDDNISLPNISPDEGLSASFNSWFTLFGQFFDHGLDLVNKGGSGTVFVPLQPDDPLYVEGSHTNFMVLTRATVSAGRRRRDGDGGRRAPGQHHDVVRRPEPDLHLAFLAPGVPAPVRARCDGKPVATGKLIEGGGVTGGMATWGEVKAQALHARHRADRLRRRQRAAAEDRSVRQLHPERDRLRAGRSPASAPTAFRTRPTTSSSPARPRPRSIRPRAGAIRTNSAFLADIAHTAVPVGKIADGDIEIGLGNPGNGSTEYDNELLDAHFIAGDGRVNENIGLTAVHHVFHSEHNRLVEQTKDVVARDAATSRSSTSGCSPTSLRCRPPRRRSPPWSGTASACSRPRSSPPRCSTSIWCSRSSRARSSRRSTPSWCRTASTPPSIRRSSPSSRTWCIASATRC